MMSGMCRQAKLLAKLQRKAIVDNFCRGRQYERLEGQKGQRLFATKTNLENLRQKGERVAEYEMFLNWHVFVSIFGQEIEEKVEEDSQSAYCSSTVNYFKN